MSRQGEVFEADIQCSKTVGLSREGDCVEHFTELVYFIAFAHVDAAEHACRFRSGVSLRSKTDVIDIVEQKDPAFELK
jgi:hypothetical protein